MASEFSLQAEPRVAGHASRARQSGFVPGVLYGRGVQPTALQVDGHALHLLLSRGGAHHLVHLRLPGDGGTHTVVLKEVQRHPVSRAVVHVDFQAVSAEQRIHAELPLRVRGEAEVARAGGVLEVILHQVRISCLPADLPDHCDVDVSALGPGRALQVRDLGLPPGVTVLEDPEEVVVHVSAARLAPAEGEAAAPGGGEAKA